MKEEEVDQYFKNKFSQYSAAPSADAWARLQNKLEPPQKKRPVMWMYYAAATITFMLLSGVLAIWLRSGEPDSTTSLARLNPVEVPLKTGLADNQELVTNAPEKLPVLSETVEHENSWAGNPGTTIEGRNVTGTKPAKKKPKYKPGILIAANKGTEQEADNKNQTTKNAAPEKSKPEFEKSSNEPALAGKQPSEGNVVEVLIKKDPAETVALNTEDGFETPEEAIRDNLNKKGKLVKNIFKQVRNLKNGEKVELTQLGFNANYRIDVESKLLKQKYTKVINL